MQGYNVTLSGNSDLSRAIEILLKNFKIFIKRELTNMLAWRLAKGVETELNLYLSSGGEFVDLSQSSKDSGNFLNMTLL